MAQRPPLRFTGETVPLHERLSQARRNEFAKRYELRFCEQRERGDRLVAEARIREEAGYKACKNADERKTYLEENLYVDSEYQSALRALNDATTSHGAAELELSCVEDEWRAYAYSVMEMFANAGAGKHTDMAVVAALNAATDKLIGLAMEREAAGVEAMGRLARDAQLDPIANVIVADQSTQAKPVRRARRVDKR